MARTTLINRVNGLGLTRRTGNVTLRSELISSANVLRGLLFRTSTTRRFTLLAFNDVVLRVLTRIALITDLDGHVAGNERLCICRILGFNRRLVMTFLERVFRFSLFSDFLLFLVGSSFLFKIRDC